MIELVSSPAWRHQAASHPAVGERSRRVPYAANRSRSIWRRTDVIWFQLANVRVTNFNLLIPSHRNLAPKLSIEPQGRVAP
jgi:hypothetical protein